jgi:glucokinase
VAGVPDVHLAIDIGGAKLTAGVVDAQGAVVVRDRVPTPSRDVWGALARLVSRVMAASPVQPVGCGVACAGPIDSSTGRASPIAIPSWREFPLGELVGELTSLPVSIDTDAQAFTAGEAWIGAARGASDVVGVLLGTGVSAGIISGGRLLRGHHGNAGGIGHIVVEPEGRACICGGQGCLDAYCTVAAIEAETGRSTQRAPVVIMERTGTLLGRALASLGAIVDLRLAVVGGPLAATFGDVMYTALRDEVDRRACLGFLRPFEVVPASLGNDAALVGAAALSRSPLRPVPTGG